MIPSAPPPLTPDELKIAYAMLFTLPGAPFVYYGDEIGMRYLPLPGGGYFRTGSAHPMQWDNSANRIFYRRSRQAVHHRWTMRTPPPWLPSRQILTACGAVQGVLNFATATRIWIPMRRSMCGCPPSKGQLPPVCLGARQADLRGEPRPRGSRTAPEAGRRYPRAACDRQSRSEGR